MAPALGLTRETGGNAISPDVTIFRTRTLILAPPSISSHEERLRDVLATNDRESTDLQMLDRLSASLISLPDATYDLVLILTDADGTRSESTSLLGRNVFTRIFRALKAGGSLQAQGGSFALDVASAEASEAILAGFVPGGDRMIKPQSTSTEAVPLRLSRTNREVGGHPERIESSTEKQNGPQIPQGNGLQAVSLSRKDDRNQSLTYGNGHHAGDDDLIDEDALLTDDDLRRPLTMPPECVPRSGKRRRACKDCTCGLAERIAAEDASKRLNADAQLQALELGVDDLAEIDFTVQGKVGSCGNCSLGDAFRCDGCPYIGMPAFKPGEEVRLLNNDVQL